MNDEHEYSPGIYAGLYLILLGLLLANVFLSRIDLGGNNLLVSLLIGFLQALIIITYLMDVRRNPPIARIVAAVGFFFLGILLILMMGDYVTRGWVPSANE